MKKYARLLPLPASGVRVEQAPLGTGSKRSSIAVACENCRQKRTKCDGLRPACTRCVHHLLECTYSVHEGETRSVALKRKCDVLEEETGQLKELLAFLVMRPESEVHEILVRIRAAQDPLSVLKFVKQGDLLLPAPSTDASSREQRLQQLDSEALHDSPIHVPAYPWTTVANDGLVSELISNFFAWEAFVFQLVHQQSFVDEIKMSSPADAKYCSPLLVNAICAIKSLTSDRARLIGAIKGYDMTEYFFAEAKRLLDSEYGRSSLPTVQALCLLFKTTSYLGRDRAGMMYRHMAYEMLKRLQLERRFTALDGNNTADALERQTISQTLWSLFCIESTTGYTYLQPSLLPPPNLPQFFGNGQQQLVDVLGVPFTSSSPQPPLVSGALNAMCDLAEMLYESMLYNKSVLTGAGTVRDIQRRTQFYADVVSYRDSLPKLLRDEENFTHQTCYLRVFTNEVVYSILSPLSLDAKLRDGTGVDEICLRHCRLDIEVMERYLEQFLLKEFSCIAITGAYNTLLNLVPLLHDARSHDLFVRACFLAGLCAQNFTTASFLLKGIQALAWSLKEVIPAPALPYFETLGVEAVDVKDVPISFMLPLNNRIHAPSSDEYGEFSKVGIPLGVLISKYSDVLWE